MRLKISLPPGPRPHLGDKVTAMVDGKLEEVATIVEVDFIAGDFIADFPIPPFPMTDSYSILGGE